jgi:hypothetical protein
VYVPVSCVKKLMRSSCWLLLSVSALDFVRMFMIFSVWLCVSLQLLLRNGPVLVTSISHHYFPLCHVSPTTLSFYMWPISNQRKIDD